MIVKALIKSQQLVLKEAGFYTGPIDGFWTPECSQAMRSLAYLGTGTQTHGNPYCTGNNLPAGYVWAEVDGQPVVAVNEGQDLGEKFISRFREMCDVQPESASPATPSASSAPAKTPKAKPQMKPQVQPKETEQPAPQNPQDAQTPSFTSAPAPEAAAKRSAEQSEGQLRSGKAK